MRMPRQATEKARIEIIPMIDIIFFLLVFFMLSTLSMTLNRSLPVNLPRATAAAQDRRDHLSITVTRAGEIFLNKESVTLQDMATRVQASLQQAPDTLAVIHADDQASHGTVVEIMDTIRVAGVAHLAIAVKPAQRSQP